MRSLTAGEITVLGSAVRRNAYLVEAQNGDGTWIDLTDWLEGFGFGRTVDDPITKATVRFRRDRSPASSFSLAPFMESSDLNVLDDGTTYSPTLDAGRGIRISIATVAAGATPAGGDFHVVFRGEIDRVAWHRSPVEVEARDLMGKLRDRFIEEITTYGSDAGVDIEDVAQSILTDWLDGETLYGPSGTVADPFPSGDSPGFLVTTTDFGEISVFQALERLAQLIGWVFRYRWNADADDYVLTFYEPDRAKVAPDWTFAPNRYIDVTRLDVDRENIRNVIAITYPGASEPLEVSDASSITRYGRRWMQFIEGDDSPIDTEAEAQALIDAALSDLKEPDAEQEIVTLLFWPIELEDLYTFTANGTHYDTDQTWAVVGFQHEVARQTERTTITVRGSVAGMYNAWLNRGGRGLGTGDLTLSVTPLEKTETQHRYRITRDSARISEVWRYSRTVEQGTEIPDIATVQDEDLPFIMTPVDVGIWDDTIPVPATDFVTYRWYVPYANSLQPGVVAGPVEVDPLDPEAPTVEEDDSESATTGTRWIKLTERGLTVTSVLMASQTGNGLAAALAAPTRGPGDASVVRGGTLGALEYEQDVELAADRLAWIWGEIDFEGSDRPISLTPLAFDRDTQPTFVSVTVNDQKVEVIADSDTESLILTRVDGGGTWEKEVDDFSHVFDLAKVDPSGNAAIGAGETWNVEVTARSDPSIAVDGSTLTRTVTKTVSAAGGGAGGPTWDIFDVEATAPADDLIAEITLKADASGGTAVIYARKDGVALWTDITGDLSPALSTAPTSSTTYTWDVPEPDGTNASYEIRADIEVTGAVVESQTERATWLFAVGA